jgi:hypothetical protein
MFLNLCALWPGDLRTISFPKRLNHGGPPRSLNEQLPRSGIRRPKVGFLFAYPDGWTAGSANANCRGEWHLRAGTAHGGECRRRPVPAWVHSRRSSSARWLRRCRLHARGQAMLHSTQRFAARSAL